jgi:hypothetical protein
VAFGLLQTQEQYPVRVTFIGESQATYSWSEFESLAMLVRPSKEECKVKYPFPEKATESARSQMLEISFS